MDQKIIAGSGRDCLNFTCLITFHRYSPAAFLCYFGILSLCNCFAGFSLYRDAPADIGDFSVQPIV